MPDQPVPTQTARRHPSAAQIYSVHPSVSNLRSIRNLLAKTTGRPLTEWARLAKAEGPASEPERTAWLRKEHGMGATTAWIISEAVEGRQTEASDLKTYLRKAPEYVDAMYAGPKAGLRPMHDALVQFCRSLGADVRVCPSKAFVGLYRSHLFAEIKPAVRTRIDLSLALKRAKGVPSARFVDTGGSAKGNRITHRVALHSLAEIDPELLTWLRAAYEQDE
jgi:hypothetical protein